MGAVSSCMTGTKTDELPKKGGGKGPIQHRAADENRVTESELQLAEIKGRMTKIT